MGLLVQQLKAASTCVVVYYGRLIRLLHCTRHRLSCAVLLSAFGSMAARRRAPLSTTPPMLPEAETSTAHDRRCMCTHPHSALKPRRIALWLVVQVAVLRPAVAVGPCPVKLCVGQFNHQSGAQTGWFWLLNRRFAGKAGAPH